MSGDLSREPDAYKKTTSVESTFSLLLKVGMTMPQERHSHRKALLKKIKQRATQSGLFFSQNFNNYNPRALMGFWGFGVLGFWGERVRARWRWCDSGLWQQI